LDGLQIYLGHLSEVNVSVGDNVAPGQQIGRTGNTGNSTGPHLHYEIRQGSGRIDPLSLEYGQVDKSIKATATPKPVSRIQANAVAPKQAYAAEIPDDPTKKKNPILGFYETPDDRLGFRVGNIGFRVGQSPMTPEQRLAAEQSGLNVWEGWLEKVKPINVIVGIIGIGLIGIGGFGIVGSETLKQAVQPVIQAVKGKT
jgi:murein DD-endopeptidase MepM/ murein hydrolase activator NlpD